MPNVRDVLQKLYELAPANLREDWDNVGLLCGSDEQPVTKILVALDATMGVLQEAKERGCDLLVTHHPMLFGSVRAVNNSSVTGKELLFAARNAIACVNLHTNLDCVCGGVGDKLAQLLRLQDAALVAPRGTDEQGRPYGYVYGGTVDQTALPEFVEFVKCALGCTGLRYADGGKPVHRVAVGGGACGDEIPTVLAHGYDTFVTADMKYHMFLDAAQMGLNLIDAGHFQTENPICAVLCDYLRASFPNIETLLSETHADPICFA
ncbi:MAG: Nif3-like dinuclear metal center hexameric protein [Oscillospiraceae bacterium]|nr:Nif3-like dinuclear metal center hexameric protein [Oscillospiraceae bacterium]